MLTQGRGTTSFEARMLAMADRLFRDYDELPVATVLRAITAARASLRAEPGLAVTPEHVDRLARKRLDSQRLPRVVPRPC